VALVVLPGADATVTDARTSAVGVSNGTAIEPVKVSQSAGNSQPPSADVTLWGSAAEAGLAVGEGSRKGGVAVGEGSRKGAVATAGFFTRVGKKIAGSF
jgi:hypothetical protein